MTIIVVLELKFKKWRNGVKGGGQLGLVIYSMVTEFL